MTFEDYLRLIKPAMELVAKKDEDYNRGTVLREDYFPFGHESYIQMMHVKQLRLISLVSSGREPNFESIQDTIYDLINYAVFYLDHLKRGA